MSSVEMVYGAFVDYFGDIKLKKLKTESGYDIYACKIKANLFLNRYIFVIVPFFRNNPLETTLNNLDWVSLQTRTSEDLHSVPEITPGGNKNALSDIINAVERTRDRTVYITTQLPIKISLMHEKKKNNELQYPDQCKLFKAVETFQCIVEIL